MTHLKIIVEETPGQLMNAIAKVLHLMFSIAIQKAANPLAEILVETRPSEAPDDTPDFESLLETVAQKCADAQASDPAWAMTVHVAITEAFIERLPHASKKYHVLTIAFADAEGKTHMAYALPSDAHSDVKERVYKIYQRYFLAHADPARAATDEEAELIVYIVGIIHQCIEQTVSRPPGTVLQ
ncbi:hypothetical protein FJY93_04940 [Candidatus Kaiserbacteria bacterium]|nr:hypothetical protein [Candidatus Kaiserbacteria bacterium]